MPQVNINQKLLLFWHFCNDFDLLKWKNAWAPETNIDFFDHFIALEVPFFIVMTKVDMTPKAKLLNTMENLKKFLLNAGSKKVPLIVKSSDDIINAVTNTPKENVVPIFIVSCVSGSGLPEVKRFLHLLPPGIGVKIREKLEQANPEFQIDEIFDVPNVGCVVSYFFINCRNCPFQLFTFQKSKTKQTDFYEKSKFESINF